VWASQFNGLSEENQWFMWIFPFGKNWNCKKDVEKKENFPVKIFPKCFGIGGWPIVSYTPNPPIPVRNVKFCGCWACVCVNFSWNHRNFCLFSVIRALTQWQPEKNIKKKKKHIKVDIGSPGKCLVENLLGRVDFRFSLSKKDGWNAQKSICVKTVVSQKCNRKINLQIF
jgi:hypothetical protein